MIRVFICNVVVCVSRVCRVVIMSQKNIYSEETDKKYSGSPSWAKYLTSLFISVSCKILRDYSGWSKQINSQKTPHTAPLPKVNNVNDLNFVILFISWKIIPNVYFNTETLE